MTKPINIILVESDYNNRQKMLKSIDEVIKVTTAIVISSLTSLSAFGQLEKISTNKQRLDSFASKLKNPDLIKLSFEGGFDSTNIEVLDKDCKILLDVRLTTNNKLGLAKSLFIEKRSFPLRIRTDSEEYLIISHTKKFIFINKIENKLLFDYSNSVRFYR